MTLHQERLPFVRRQVKLLAFRSPRLLQVYAGQTQREVSLGRYHHEPSLFYDAQQLIGTLGVHKGSFLLPTYKYLSATALRPTVRVTCVPVGSVFQELIVVSDDPHLVVFQDYRHYAFTGRHFRQYGIANHAW